MNPKQTTDPGASPFNQHLARIAVGGYDDAQEIRKALMNRVRDIIRKKREGIPFDTVEDEKDPSEQDFAAEYKDDNLPELVKEMNESGKLSDRELDYLQQILSAAQTVRDVEDQYKGVMAITEMEPIYTSYLEHVYGVSNILTARLLHRFGYCEKFDRVSHLWSYSGLAPGQERTQGEKLGFDPQAKTLAWLVADNMVRQGSNSMYREAFYDPYKEKQLNRMERSDCEECGSPTHEHNYDDGASSYTCADGTEVSLQDFSIRHYDGDGTPPWSKGHADNRAKRYLAKKFLKHYWAIARDLKDLDVPEEYIIAHGGHEKRDDTFENPFYAQRELRNRE